MRTDVNKRILFLKLRVRTKKRMLRIKITRKIEDEIETRCVPKTNRLLFTRTVTALEPLRLRENQRNGAFVVVICFNYIDLDF